MTTGAANFNALIIDDERDKLELLKIAVSIAGGIAVKEAASFEEVTKLYESGDIDPSIIDVAFIDSNLGYGKHGGKDVVDYLLYRNPTLLRTPYGLNTTDKAVVPDDNKIVVVGSSSMKEWASEIGSYSDAIQGPLVVNWPDIPARLGPIADEVRRLRQIPTE